ncbi:MerR family transcriptional regulator [[Kitasatospora] papulosa]|uniref:MerR family transcriptional regulator n=1 Tax=[Kitasatospora] papulosa TaxID=1464011 RepID=UPI00196153D5
MAERFGVPATALRFYEEAGLLPADRTPSGCRVYGEEAVEHLAKCVRRRGAGRRIPWGPVPLFVSRRSPGG